MESMIWECSNLWHAKIDYQPLRKLGAGCLDDAGAVVVVVVVWVPAAKVPIAGATTTAVTISRRAITGSIQRMYCLRIILLPFHRVS